MKYNLVNRFLCFSNDKNSIMNFIWILLSKNFYPQKISPKKSPDFRAQKYVLKIYIQKFLIENSYFKKMYFLKFISKNIP